MTWFHQVSKDLKFIPDAVEYYENELNQARKEVKIFGNIEKNSFELPGIMENRFTQLQEIEAILEFLNIEYKRLRSKTFKKYFETYNRALSSREVDKYIDGDDSVVEYANLVNEFALLRNKWLGIIKSLEIKMWQLSNIIKLRTAGLEDVSV